MRAYIAYSLLLHGLIFGYDYFLGFLYRDARASVKNAPSSVEVVIKKIKKPEEVVEIEEIEPDIASLVIAKKKKKPKKQKKELPSQQGRGAEYDKKPQLISNPAPSYPSLARRMGWQGTSRIRVVINARGIPVKIELVKSSGYPVLDKAALQTIETWKFSPAKLAGASIESSVIVPVKFKLVGI